MSGARDGTATHRHRWARRALVAGAALLVGTGLTGCDPGHRLANGRTVAPGEVVLSPNRTYRLEVQTDGNVVLRKVGGAALWTSKTPGNAGASLTMQANGRLALVSSAGRTVWSTPSGGTGAWVELGDDANLVLHGAAGQPVWASGSSPASASRKPLRDRTTSTHQIVLTKLYEGLVASKPYLNSGGNCTVGYGHLIRRGPCTAADKTKAWDADALFAVDVAEHERRIKSTLGSVPVTQREFDALFDFAFNRGSISATSAPSIHAALTAKPPRYAAVGPALRTAGDASIRGLCDRRYDEAEVFEGGRYDRNARCS